MINDEYIVDTDSRYPMFSDINTSDAIVSYPPPAPRMRRPAPKYKIERYERAPAPDVLELTDRQLTLLFFVLIIVLVIINLKTTYELRAALLNSGARR